MTLEAIKISKNYGNKQILYDIDVQINIRNINGLLGPNGAGKTTLVEMIEGVQFPDSGEIRILDRSWEKDEHFLRKQIGLALQETRFLDRLTVEETLNLFASFYSLEKERPREVI